MKNFISNISKFKIIVFTVILLTLAYTFISMSEGFTEEEIQSESFSSFLFDKFNGKCNLGIIKTEKDTLLAVLNEKERNVGLKFQLRNMRTDKLNTYDIYNESAGYLNSLEFNELYSDEKDSAVYFITTRNNADLYLNKYKIEDGISVEKNFIFRHPDFDQLLDSTTTINDIKYYGIGLINDEKEDSLDVVKYNDGYKIFLKKKLLKKLHIYPPATGEFTDIYNEIINIFKMKHNINPDLKDILQVRMFFNMRNNYFKHFKVKDFREITDFVRSDIFGKFDANNDGVDDVMILISGNRFVNDLILCYDEINKNILWSKEFTKDIILGSIDVVDIDSDNKKEIVFGNYSPCSQPPPDYFDNWDETGLPFFPYFVILDNKGNFKRINNQPVKHNMMKQGGFYETKFLYLQKLNKFLIGFRSPSDYDEKRLLLFDVEKNKIDTTEISYNSIYTMYLDNGRIKALNYFESKTELLTISDNGELIDRKIIANEYLRFEMNADIEINEERYYALGLPFSLYDKNFNCIYKSNFDIKFPFIHFGDGKFALRSILTEQNGNYNEILRLLKLKKTHHFKKAGLIALGIELILLLLYFFIRSTLFLPLPSAHRNYITLFSIFGFIHLIKSHGNKNLFVFSKKLSKNKEHLIEAINQIDNTAKVISSKSFLFYKYEVYEITSHDEMLAIQIIAHDIKNNIANIKFLTDRGITGSDQNLKNTIKTALNNSVKLSNFTNLMKINYTKVNIEKILNKAIREFIVNNDQIQIHPDFNIQNKELLLDEKKFDIVLRNLFQNAVDASNKISLSVSENDSKIIISIKNSLNSEIDIEKIKKLGFTTKKTGTGTGLYIVHRIVESMKGEFDIQIIDGQFIVTLKLKRTMKVNKHEK